MIDDNEQNNFKQKNTLAAHMNHTSKTGLENNPKLKLLINLRRKCYTDFNVSHSTTVENIENYLNDDVFWCPRTFDGFACWDPTPGATTATQLCPSFIIGFDPRRYAYKRCTENATWYRKPGESRPWTDYTTCVDIEDLKFRNIVNNIYVAGYSISVAALVLSMMIFIYFKTLQCSRIRVHMHMFTSTALNGVMWIIWYKAVINNVTVVQENYVWCQVVNIVTNYFMVTSYMWMFCEGLHLHVALVVVFMKEEVAMQWFISVGWIFPIVILAVYAVTRYYTPGATERCWMEYDDSFWIITIPVLLSLIASLVFLVNVVRVLVTKLHPQPVGNNVAVATKKAVRAALILIPLFGLHFMLIPLRPSPDTQGERIYQVFSALLTSLQGLCVAVLFCFTNHDVVSVIRPHLAGLRQSAEAVPMTGMTACESNANTRENILY